MGTPRPALPLRRINLPSGAELELRTRVHALLSAMYPHGVTLERRVEVRYPYPSLVYLTPVGDDGYNPCGESLVVVGKHLSEHGLSFYHREPLHHRRVIASLEAGRRQWMGVLVDLKWCRFTRHGWYESGGRFLQIVPSPLRQGG
jgi:hypothetical protein